MGTFTISMVIFNFFNNYVKWPEGTQGVSRIQPLFLLHHFFHCISYSKSQTTNCRELDLRIYQLREQPYEVTQVQDYLSYFAWLKDIYFLLQPFFRSHRIIWSIAKWKNISMAMTQEPKLGVPTIYEAYFLCLCRGISPQNIAKNMAKHMAKKYGTNVPPFQDPETPIEYIADLH